MPQATWGCRRLPPPEGSSTTLTDVLAVYGAGLSTVLGVSGLWIGLASRRTRVRVSVERRHDPATTPPEIRTCLVLLNRSDHPVEVVRAGFRLPEGQRLTYWPPHGRLPLTLAAHGGSDRLFLDRGDELWLADQGIGWRTGFVAYADIGSRIVWSQRYVADKAGDVHKRWRFRSPPR
jgi:hypothetical protein